MSDRLIARESHQPAVILKAPPNWTGAVFFGALAALHLSMAAGALAAGRWEAHMSALFGVLFLAVAGVWVAARRTIEICPGRQRVIVRVGVRGVASERTVPFSRVLSVRVVLLNSGGRHESNVTIICRDEDIELPATAAPRQQALVLAVAMGVRLVKVYADGGTAEPEGRIAKLYSNDEENVV